MNVVYFNDVVRQERVIVVLVRDDALRMPMVAVHIGYNRAFMKYVLGVFAYSCAAVLKVLIDVSYYGRLLKSVVA